MGNPDKRRTRGKTGATPDLMIGLANEERQEERHGVVIVAKWGGECPRCKTKIKKGESCLWVSGMGISHRPGDCPKNQSRKLPLGQRFITAKFEQGCYVCEEMIDKGTECVLSIPKNRARHIGCE